ncbi:hypothetical protein ACC721_37390, partial [Rhizobium ruizarguesonis]
MVSARWDFPIRYDCSDIDQMWIDTDFLKGTCAKAPSPPAGGTYRILLQPTATARPLPGRSSASYRSVAGLTAREAGTVIGT